MASTHENIILFDGVCNFCNSSINFIIKKDTHKKFKFCSLQSDKGQSYVQKFQLHHIDSIILISNNKAYIKSNAILSIAKKLGSVYLLAYGFIIIPTFLRNYIYDFIAKNRYKWFGQKDECMIPTPDVRERFI